MGHNLWFSLILRCFTNIYESSKCDLPRKMKSRNSYQQDENIFQECCTIKLGYLLSLSLPLSPRQGDIWCAPLWPSNVRKSGPSDTAKRLGCTPKSCMAFSTKTSISGTWSLDTARWTNKTWDVIIVPMKYVAMMRNDQIMGISNNMEKSWNTTIPIGYAVCPI